MGEYPSENENAPGDRGARKNVSASSNACQQPAGKPKEQDWEDRRNAAACFKNRDKREDWHADFLGGDGHRGTTSRHTRLGQC